MSTFTIPTIFSAVDKISAPLKKMTAGMQSFARKSEAGIARLDRRLRRLTPSLGGLGKQMLAFASTAALVAFFATTGRSILDFEDNLVGVGKTTGLAGAELKKLGLDTIALSNDLKTISSNKLLELAQSAGQLGVDGSENILNFSETLAKLEQATDIEGEQGASSIARIINVTGEGIGIVDKFGASLVALGNNSAATESEILEVANEVSRSVAAYDLSSASILGISARMKEMGVAPQSAGSAIGTVFLNMEKATLKGGKSLQRFADVMGVMPKEVEKLLKSDPEKAFLQFTKGLSEIKSSGGSVTETMTNLGLANKITLKGIIPLTGEYIKLEDKLDLANKSFDANLALNEEFNASQKTVKNAFNSIIIAWTNLTTKQAVAGTGMQSIQRALFFVSENMGTVITVIGVLVGSFIALKTIIFISQGVMIAYNAILGAIAVVSMIKYIASTQGMTFAQAAFNVVLAANPIGLVIIAIAAMIALIAVVIANYDTWGASVTFLLGPLGLVINQIQAFRRNWDMVSEAFSKGGVLAGFKAIGVVILDSLLMPLQQVLGLIESFTGLSLGAASIGNLRAELGVVTEDKETLNPEAAKQDALVSKISEEKSETKDINLTVNGEKINTDGTGSANNVNLSSTLLGGQ